MGMMGLPTRFLVPASNFTACFGKIAYKAIQMIFIANNINPMKRTIVQSSHLKCQLEDLNLKADNCTVCSLDIINMYPSIKAKLIRKAVSHFSQGLNVRPLKPYPLIKLSVEYLALRDLQAPP